MISLRFFRKNKVILVHIFLTFELTFPGCFLQYFQPALRRQTGHNRLIFDTNHGLFSDCFQEKSRGLFLSEKGRLAKCLTRQILNKKVCTSAHCRSALQSGQMQTQNQMKGVLPCRSTSQPGTSAAQNSSPSPTGCIWAHRKPRVWTSWNSACRSSGTGVSSPSTSGTRTACWPSRWRWTKQAASAWAGALPAGPAASGCWPLPTAMATPPTPGPASTTSTASSPPRAAVRS